MNHLQKKIAHLQKKKDKITEEMNSLFEKRNKELLAILSQTSSPSLVLPSAGGLFMSVSRRLLILTLLKSGRIVG